MIAPARTAAIIARSAVRAAASSAWVSSARAALLAVALAALAQPACVCGERPAAPAMQITGESFKPRRGEPLPRESALYDGRTVALRGVRGETLGLQVAFDTSGGPREPVAVSLAFRDAAGAVAVQGFAVDWVEVTRPSTRMYGPSRGRGGYPDRLVPRDGPVETDALAYFDVSITPAAAPGSLAGALSVGDRAIPVSLVVERLPGAASGAFGAASGGAPGGASSGASGGAPVGAIDLEASPLVWVWYHPREVSEAHAAAVGSPEGLAWERRYAALFRAHGAYLADGMTREAYAAREDMLAGVRYIPVELDTRDESALAADVIGWIELFRDRPQTPFAIPVDEPRSREARERVNLLARWAAAAERAAGAGPDAFLFAVTAAPDPMFRDVDVFVSWKALPRSPAAGDAAAWTYNGAPPFAGSVIIDTDGAALRSWGWIAERYDVPLWYAWEGTYFDDRYNAGTRGERGGRGGRDVRVADRDPLRDPASFDDGQDVGNGDGMLVYPGPLPSLRLKALRRGLQDRLLVRALRACGPEAARVADAIVRRMVPRALGEARSGARQSWPRDEPAWERARNEVLDAIAAHCPFAPDSGEPSSR